MEELFGANGQASEWADQAIALIMLMPPQRFCWRLLR